jgi:hypothetical protein
MPYSESLRDLYPTLSEEELKQAEENLRRYFKIALEICEEQFPDVQDTPIDSRQASPTMEERSNVSLKS